MTSSSFGLSCNIPLDQGVRLAFDLNVAELEPRLRFFEGALCLLDRGLVEALLNHEQKVAFLNVPALGEQTLLEKTVDAGAQIDLEHRLDAAGEGGGGSDVLRDHAFHGDGRRGRDLLRREP